MTTGAEVLVRAAVDAGLEVCFANPGTTELALVSALEHTPTLRAVLVLFEGVAAGAADGYARMTGKPALAMFHLGPSLGNALANLHNARRGGSPIVVLVGDHPAEHRRLDPPLASDVEGIAGSVSGFVRTVTSAAAISTDLADAVAASRAGHVATLVVPADMQWSDAPAQQIAAAKPRVAEPRFDARASALALRQAGTAGVLLLGNTGLRARGLDAAARIAQVTGTRLFMETFPARFDGGLGAPSVERLAYVPALARSQLGSARMIALAGAAPPVAYFAEAGQPSSLVPPGVVVHDVANAGGDVGDQLERIAAELGATQPRAIAPRVQAQVPRSDAVFNVMTVVEAIAALQPTDAIFVDEGVSAGGAYLRVSPLAPSHSYLSLTGGATGWGLPCAIGAAIACPRRKVIAFVGDGSALYTVQSLWSIAREDLDVVTIILSNAEYKILQLELARRHGAVGPVGRRLTELTPRIDWIALARSVGFTDAVTVTRTDTLLAELSRCFARRGPDLLELRLR